MWRDQWHEQAACGGSDASEHMFGTRLEDVRHALNVCARCPVTLECLAEALDQQIMSGVWGGMEERDRHELLLRHPHVTWKSHLQQFKKGEAAIRGKVSASQTGSMPAFMRYED